ncbi:MAG: glycosyltransferase family 2 protein [Bacteroidota bacterium]|nr:glycosyltransferase family 2 protein [Bacteroidota bacterium]
MGNIYPKISLITPNFNGGEYLEQTICSVLDQKYPNLEYIIIDGKSSDNSLNIIDKYRKYLHYFVSEPDFGQSDAINKGLKMCTGEIFNWLNSDDYYESSSLYIVADAFSSSKASIVSGNANIVNKHGNKIRETRGIVQYSNLAKTIGWVAINQPEVFWKTNVVKQLGGINPSLHYNMDKELWIKYLLKFGMNNVLKVDKTLVNFRLQPLSKTVSQNDQFTIERDLLFASIAKWAGLTNELEFIMKNNSIQLPEFQIDIPKNNFLVQSIFQYFFLLKADEYYVEGKIDQSKKFLDFIGSKIKLAEPRLFLSLFLKLKFRL